MTDIILRSTSGRGQLKEYAKIIEEKLGKKLNYDKENNHYYYVVYALDDLLDIIDVMEEIGYECIIYKPEIDIKNTYVLEV